MDVTYEEALAVCIQYYVDRDNPVELATLIVGKGEKRIFDLYNKIQEEKKLPPVKINIVDLLHRE